MRRKGQSGNGEGGGERALNSVISRRTNTRGKAARRGKMGGKRGMRSGRKRRHEEEERKRARATKIEAEREKESE